MKGSGTGRQDTWAVFNLAIQPDNLEFFAVEPGLKDRGTNAEIKCRVFLHADSRAHPRPKSQVPLRKIEILPNSGEDWAAYECERQFALAVRLFKPGFFWVSSWERRHDVRLPSALLPECRVEGLELTRLCEFSKRLKVLHPMRDWHRFNRKAAEMMPDRQPELKDIREIVHGEVGGQTGPVLAALDLFENAHESWSLPPEIRLILLMMSAEALLSDDDRGELAFRLCHRLAVLNGADSVQRKSIFKSSKKLYEIRSRLMHGSTYDRKRGFVIVTWDELTLLNRLVVSSLLYYLALVAFGEFDKSKVLSRLDVALHDEKEIVFLRSTANAHWGFEASPNEHLFAGELYAGERK